MFLVPLAAAATLVFTPLLVVARSVARGRDALLLARPLRAEIRPRWLSDGSLDLSMLVRNRLNRPVRIAAAIAVSPPGMDLAIQPNAQGGTAGVLVDMPLPADSTAADWVLLRANPPRDWAGGRLAVRLTLAEADGAARSMLVRARIVPPAAAG